MLVSAAHKLALEWGDGSIEVEHLLGAALESQTPAGRALRSAGLTREALRDSLDVGATSAVPVTPAQAAGPGSARVLGEGARDFISCAQGVAAAFGAEEASAEHLLVALCWTGPRSLAQRLLEGLAGGRARIAAELRSQGARLPDGDPPPWPAWGPVQVLNPENFAAREAALRAAGVAYMVNYRDGRVILVEDEG